MAELQRTNATLLQKLDASVAEIARLRKSGGDSPVKAELTGNPAARISHLAKKNREMIASVNAEKAKASKLQNKIAELEQEVQSKVREGEKLQRISYKLRKQLDGGSNNNNNGGGGGSASAQQQAAAAAAEKKVPESERLVEARQETNILKQQLKMAHSALSKEIGSDIPLSRVLGSESGWKGRADQISMLKGKVTELTAKLESEGKLAPAPPQAKSPGSNIEARNRKAVQKLDMVRRQQMEQASIELEMLRGQYGTLKEKCDGLKARTKTLSRDGKVLKTKIEEGNKRSEKDATVIENLKAQLIRAAKSQLERASPTFGAVVTNGAQAAEVSRLSAVCEQYRARVATLETALQQGADGAGSQRQHRSPADAARMASLASLCEQQNDRIASLEGQLRAARRAGSATSFSSPRPSSSSSSRPSSGVHGDSAEVARLKALCDQQQSHISALENRAAATAAGVSGGGGGRPSSSRGGSRPSSGLRQSPSDHEHVFLFRAAEEQNKKLTALVEMLKERLADAEEKALRPQEPPAISSEDIPVGFTLEAAWSKISIQQDNNRILREALEDTVEAKENEITLLHSMMKNIRKVFSEGLRQAKNQGTTSGPTSRASSRGGSGRSRPRPPPN